MPEALQDTTRYRPVPGGCSIGPEATVSAGTLGGWACDERDETTVMVSNNHVISNLDAMPTLRRIVQPARLDGGVLPGDVIGRLKRHQQVNTVANPPTVPVPTSVVDAAIGSIDAGIDIDHDVLAIGPAIYELRAPALNMNVQKRGRTTQLTTNGRVTTVGATFTCTYRNRTRISQIQNAFRITSTDGNPFGSPGDSGSLIFDQAAGQLNGTRPVVGLLYAGGTFTNPPTFRSPTPTTSMPCLVPSISPPCATAWSERSSGRSSVAAPPTRAPPPVSNGSSAGSGPGLPTPSSGPPSMIWSLARRRPPGGSWHRMMRRSTSR